MGRTIGPAQRGFWRQGSAKCARVVKQVLGPGHAAFLCNDLLAYVLRKPAAMREATACARRDARMERTRALNAKGLIGGRLFRRSSRSRLRICLRSHAPISSQEQVTLVHVRCELTLLPQCFRPLAQHLVSTGGSGPAGLVVGSHAEVARARHKRIVPTLSAQT